MAIRHYHLDYGSIRVENFPENEIQLAVIHAHMGEQQTIAIDSTGIKYNSVWFYLPSELLKHAKKAVFYTNAKAPSATDASVRVELIDASTGDLIAYTIYSGTGGDASADVDISTLKNYAGKKLQIRLNVLTASATAGATQTFREAELIIYLGIS